VHVPNAAETALNYAERVIQGTEIAGNLVKLACQRFLNDLETGKDRGLYFDTKAAQTAVNFFQCLHHIDGKWAREVPGDPDATVFRLADWQIFVVANLFGWKKTEDNARRFREAYIEIARKNGKSTFAAGIGLYMLVADKEPGAEVYSAAVTRDQARIVWETARDMVAKSAFLSKRIKTFQANLTVASTSSKFEPLAAEAGPIEGKNTHCAIVDELHVHPSRAIYEVLNTSITAREQPLLLAITTAGKYNPESVCWKQREFGVHILSGVYSETQADVDYFFPYIAALDEGDDWQDEKNWAKANPNLAVFGINKLRPDATKAKADPSSLNDFLQKHLNQWTAQKTSWLPVGTWKRNTQVETGHTIAARNAALEALKGRRCFGGLDLAETIDMAAMCLLFPPCKEQMGLDPENRSKQIVIRAADPIWRVLMWYWYPERAISFESLKGDRTPYEAWSRDGHLIKTPGSSIEQEAIRNKILELNRQYTITEFGYDKWGTEWLGPKLLSDGIKSTKIPQIMEHMSIPTKKLTALLTSREVEHYANPILEWNAANVEILTDTNGNWRPDKKASRNKIDGIVALVIALNRAEANPVVNDDVNRFAVRFI